MKNTAGEAVSVREIVSFRQNAEMTCQRLFSLTSETRVRSHEAADASRVVLRKAQAIISEVTEVAWGSCELYWREPWEQERQQEQGI